MSFLQNPYIGFNGAVTLSLQKFRNVAEYTEANCNLLQWSCNFIVTEIRCTEPSIQVLREWLQWSCNFIVTEISDPVMVKLISSSGFNGAVTLSLQKLLTTLMMDKMYVLASMEL